MSSVVSLTVANGFCCGCGMCAGICPSHALKMEWNHYGEYNPIRIADCKKECGLCIKVCPFADGNDNEDIIGDKVFGGNPNIQQRSETGYYMSSGIGAVSDENHRMTSSSGGLASWFIAHLLEQNIVDGVICAGHSQVDGKLFNFFVAKTPAEIYTSTGSVYYPLEMSEMLQYIHEKPGRYAIVGLPCVLKGIRLAQERFAYLRERIVLLVGLSCSNLKSSRFTEYAAWYSGISERIAWCTFRGKSKVLSQNYFNIVVKDINGKFSTCNWGSGQLWDMYFERCFTLHSCDCCDDMFAECADVTFMDAWLPECAEEPRGTSLWIARSKIAEDILTLGRQEMQIDALPIPIERVIRSQSSLRWKREMLKYRLLLMQERGEKCPVKRVSPEMGNLSFVERDKVKKSLEIQRESRLRSATDEFAEIEKWFDKTCKDRSVVVRVYYRVRSVPVAVYRKCEKHPIVQRFMRRASSILRG